MKPESQGITHQRVLNIAIPVVLASLALPILGAVNTAVVGQMGAYQRGEVAALLTRVFVYWRGRWRGVGGTAATIILGGISDLSSIG